MIHDTTSSGQALKNRANSSIATRCSRNPQTCGICNKGGHNKIECPQMQRHTCKQYGHISPYCPQNSEVTQTTSHSVAQLVQTRGPLTATLGKQGTMSTASVQVCALPQAPVQIAPPSTIFEESSVIRGPMKTIGPTEELPVVICPPQNSLGTRHNDIEETDEVLQENLEEKSKEDEEEVSEEDLQEGFNVDPEEEPEEDQESDLEIDMEAESCLKPNKECANELMVHNDTPVFRNHKLGIGVDAKTVTSEVLDVESGSKQREPAGLSGKQRRRMWDVQAEQDKETVEVDKETKRRKTRWGSDLPQFGPVQLPEFVKDFLESETSKRVQKLKRRLLGVSQEIHSLQVLDGMLKQEESTSAHLNSSFSLRESARYKQEELVKERQRILSDLLRKKPTLRIPPNLMPPKISRKIYIPVNEYPSFNFRGLIIGPRGNTLKKMENDSGAKIILRGKGTWSKGSRAPSASEEEDMHVIIEAENQNSVDTAAAMVEKLLTPIDGKMNDFKRNQLKELAALNGTNKCRLCNELGHRDYACPNQRSTFDKVTVCTKCGTIHLPTSCCVIAVPDLGNPSVSSAGFGVGLGPNAEPKPKPNREINEASLYVAYLPQTVDENRLKELFCPFGEIVNVRLFKDRKTGLSRGFGFVNFARPEDAAMALKHMNGHQMDGNKLQVKVAGQPSQPKLPALSLHPRHPGPAAIPSNIPSQTRPCRGLPHPVLAQRGANQPALKEMCPLSPLPHPRPAAISTNSSSQMGPWLGPARSILPKPPCPILNTMGLNTRDPLEQYYNCPLGKAMNMLPSGSGNVGPQMLSNFDPSGFSKQALFSSPVLSEKFSGGSDYHTSSSQFPGDPDYRSSSALFPGDPNYHSSSKLFSSDPGCHGQS